MSTASHGKLMVNIEEYTQQHLFNIVLNMQSRSRENHIHVPSSPEYIELCITVAASILDKISSDNVSVRIFANTPPESVEMEPLSDDEIGSQVLVTQPSRGKQDVIAALRLLAALKMEISCPFEKMLDHIAASPEYYANAGNLVVISSYLDERMINFHQAMRLQGINVMFYITTINQNTLSIPDDIEVFYKTFIA